MEACRVLDSYKTLEEFVINKGLSTDQQKSFSIAIADTFTRGSFVDREILIKIESQYKDITVEVRHYSPSACVEAVRNNTIDAAIVLGKVENTGLISVKIAEKTPLVMLSDNHPFAQFGKLSLSCFDNTLVAAQLDHYCFEAILSERCSAHNLSPLFIEIFPRIENQREFMHEQNGVIFVTDDLSLHETYQQTVFLPICSEDAFSLPLSLIYREDNKKPALKALKMLLQ